MSIILNGMTYICNASTPLGIGYYGIVFQFYDQNRNTVVIKFLKDKKSYLNEEKFLQIIDMARTSNYQDNFRHISFYLDSGILMYNSTNKNFLTDRLRDFINDKYTFMEYKYCIITKFVEGISLSLCELSRLSRDVLCKLTRDMLVSLIILENLGISHHDIALRNILYDKNGNNFILIDFGNCCFIENTKGFKHDWLCLNDILCKVSYRNFREYPIIFKGIKSIQLAFSMYLSKIALCSGRQITDPNMRAGSLPVAGSIGLFSLAKAEKIIP